MFADVPQELRQRKNSKFMQPAVQFAALQDVAGVVQPSGAAGGAGGAGAGAAGAGGAGAEASKPSRSSVTPEYEQEDELTPHDVEKLVESLPVRFAVGCCSGRSLFAGADCAAVCCDVIQMEQCKGEPVSIGSFGRVYRVHLFAQSWACKIINAELVSRQAIRSEVRGPCAVLCCCLVECCVSCRLVRDHLLCRADTHCVSCCVFGVADSSASQAPRAPLRAVQRLLHKRQSSGHSQ